MVCYDKSKKATIKPTPTIMMQSLSNHFNGSVRLVRHGDQAGQDSHVPLVDPAPGAHL